MGLDLDEKALRKPEFVEGVRVKLGDGQEWSLPKPRLRLVPQKTGAGDIELWSRPVYSAERQADLDIVLAGAPSDDNEAFWRWLESRSRLAAGLLLDNYDLDNAALAELLPTDFGDDANRSMWGGVAAALMGREPPKPSAAG